MFRVTKQFQTSQHYYIFSQNDGLSRSDARSVVEYSGRKAINTIVKLGLRPLAKYIYTDSLVILEVLLAQQWFKVD